METKSRGIAEAFTVVGSVQWPLQCCSSVRRVSHSLQCTEHVSLACQCRVLVQSQPRMTLPIRPASPQVAHGLPQLQGRVVSVIRVCRLTAGKICSRTHFSFALAAWSAMLDLTSAAPFRKLSIRCTRCRSVVIVLLTELILRLLLLHGSILSRTGLCRQARLVVGPQCAQQSKGTRCGSSFPPTSLGVERPIRFAKHLMYPATTEASRVKLLFGSCWIGGWQLGS